MLLVIAPIFHATLLLYALTLVLLAHYGILMGTLTSIRTEKAANLSGEFRKIYLDKSSEVCYNCSR